MLNTVLDPKSVTAGLASAVDCSPRLISVSVVSAQLVSKRRDRRALVAFTLERGSHAGRFLVLGKHFREGVRAQRMHDITTALWRHVREKGCSFDVPEPLGWLPSLSLVLYLPAEGAHLDKAVAGRRALRSLTRLAFCLAELHDSTVVLDRHLDLFTERTNLGFWAKTVASELPEFGEMALEISDRLQHHPVELSEEVPIHKDLHYHHVILGRQPTLIDFDEMRLGPRSFDLAHFCVYLDLLALRSPLKRARLVALKQWFLKTYSHLTDWTADEGFTYFSAYSCLKIAKQLATGSGIPPTPQSNGLHYEMEQILAQGLTLAQGLS